MLMVSVIIYVLIGAGLYWVARNTSKTTYYVLTSIPLLLLILINTALMGLFGYFVYLFVLFIMIIIYYSWVTSLWRTSIEGEKTWFIFIYIFFPSMIVYWIVNVKNV